MAAKNNICKGLSKVTQMKLKSGMTVDDLVKEMGRSGVMGAGRISHASDIMEKMFVDKDCTVFLGLAGAMVPGGMKAIIIDLLKSGKVDVLVTTGANLTHDLIESLGYSHFQGTQNIDDKELNKQKVDRIYDSFMPNEVYEGMEDFFEKNFDKLAKTKKNIKEFLWELASLLPKSDSILKTCYEMKIPIFCPGIADSGIGLMIWGHIARGKNIDVNAFDDLKEILQIAWDCKRAGIIYLGGGVPKNYIQQAMQFSPKGADYGIQITMDRPEPGGSSGAELREGISWGKMSKKGYFVDVICDVTIALPIIYASVKDRMKI
ncbi:deoxyhypusine synthase [Candidatus Woesearchaeota archaeon CG11_big_fil_rev_8_21_14_0_20_43_8]|nr:MAG: deoxyhypusine synthase [Candidatus Woesearchaeota archaeon CG11_big_fil_rev_8_21_14_0_20_43_8]PIO05634.1 MAG: deoxyhypusine synthase [Candidatus Woesearchaeota archaeon CG08_land_8_20_14_0_20_43_7]